MNSFEKTYQLPSNGFFGGPKEITLRAMTTKEEKILLTARDFSMFDRIVKSCCVSPKDLDMGLLHQNDIMYLVYALRELTFGNTYIQDIKCPECGFNQEAEIDIADMEVNILDTDNMDERLTVKLPVSGDTLQLRLLSSGDIKTINSQIKQKVAKGKIQDPDSYEFLVKLSETIVNKNGEEFESNEEKRHYADNLNLRDLVAIQNTLNKINFGLDNRVVITCAKCNEDVEVNGLICPEFFRPSK